MPMSDRADLHLRAALPTLEDVVTAGTGLFIVKEGELLTGWHRHLYVEGFLGLEVAGDGTTPLRAYQIVTPGA